MSRSAQEIIEAAERGEIPTATDKLKLTTAQLVSLAKRGLATLTSADHMRFTTEDWVALRGDGTQLSG